MLNALPLPHVYGNVVTNATFMGPAGHGRVPGSRPGRQDGHRGWTTCKCGNRHCQKWPPGRPGGDPGDKSHLTDEAGIFPGDRLVNRSAHGIRYPASSPSEGRLPIRTHERLYFAAVPLPPPGQSPRTRRNPRSTSLMRADGRCPVSASRSALSRVTRAVTLTTESLGRPDEVAGRKTLPGMAASPVLEVMTAARVVLSLLALNGSACMTRTGRRLAGLLPRGSPRSAQQMLPRRVTTHPRWLAVGGRPGLPRRRSHRCQQPAARRRPAV
jgi:hypothetical protein